MKREIIRLADIIDSRRMDASFLMARLKTNGLVSLSQYVHIKGGKRLPKGSSFIHDDSDYLYLRLSDIKDVDDIGYDALQRIDEATFMRLRRYEVRENDIIFSIAEPIGRVFILKNVLPGKRVILTENCAMLQPVNSSVSAEFISILLNCDFVKNQIGQSHIKTTIPKFGLERIARLKIPEIPPLEIQQRIVALYNEALSEKKMLDREAAELLEGIDGLILKALRISGNTDRGSESVFVTKLSDILGRRLDVSSYKPHFEMTSGIYPNARLSSLMEINPAIRFKEEDQDTLISFVPMECVDETFGEITEKRHIPISQTKSYTKFEEGDLLWAKITPCMQNGKSAVARHLLNGKGCGSTEFFVIRPKSPEVLIDYVHLILRHSGILEAAQSVLGGTAGQQRVPAQFLKDLVLPYPGPDVQQMIVDKVNDRKARARILAHKGQSLLDDTKRKIEKIILE